MSKPLSSPPPVIDPAVVRQVGADDDLVSVFCASAESVGLQVSLSLPDALARDVAVLAGQLASEANRPKVLLEPALFCHARLVEALGDTAQLLDPNAGDDAVFSADVGITGVHAAVAETGSLVCTSGPDQWRGLSLIPPAHIAIVRAAQIVPDLLDLFTTGLPDSLPANLTLISGPSKTADIEGILITGVHGPGQVHVIVVDDQPAKRGDQE